MLDFRKYGRQARIIPASIIKPSQGTYRHTAFYLELARKDVDHALRILRSTVLGLSQADVIDRLELQGRNEIVHEKRDEWYLQFLKTFVNPFIVLLMGISLVSFLTGDKPGGTIVGVMVLVSVVLTYFQEFRSSRAAERLKEMVTTTATVLRQDSFVMTVENTKPLSGGAFNRCEVPIAELVPGDVISLSAGDMIPADLRLISSKDLFVSQSALTGEALPVEKHAIDVTLSESLLEQKTICFMGSNVVSGTATGVIIKTGPETYFGSLAKSISGQRLQTSFDRGIVRFTWFMLRVMLVTVPLVFVINGFLKGDWVEAFMFAIAVAVGLTPEMLPMIVTVNLAKGALAMAKKKVIVKRLNSIQNFGAMDVLCTDKTGTLTQDKVVLEKYVDIFGEPDPLVLKMAYLNSYYQTGLKNLLDQAVLKKNELNQEFHIQTDYRKIDEIPFDFERRRMSVIVEERGEKQILICKGALEEILNVSTDVQVRGEAVPIGSDLEEEMMKVAQEMNADGLRIIAVAYKHLPVTYKEYQIKDESELTVLGFIAFLDPPKETASLAISTLNQMGVAVKVLTGDNETVTRKICSQVGINCKRVLLGHEIEKMEDQEILDAVEDVHVYAKLTPAQKERIIKMLHRKKHVVGFLGDGINDSAALRAADVGISVDNAVDIAKESADIILLEKSLLVLENGVLEGRKVFGNIVKYIKMGASSNFGNIFSVLGASVILPFLPMMPVQLLVQNLLYDLSQTAIPFDQVDPEYLARPRRWEIGEIGRFMVWIGPISSIFDYMTFAVMWFVFKANSPAHQTLFQTGWFVEGLLSQTLIVHMIRTQKIPFLESKASWPLIMTTLAVMAVGVYIPYSWLAPKLGMVALPGHYFAWLILILVGYATLTHFVKTWFVRRFGFN